MTFLPTWIVLFLAMISGSSHAEQIKVVTESTSYSYLQDGKVAGPASEVVESTLQRAGLTDFQIGLYPWARAYDRALQEPNVLIYLIARTPVRESLFKWVGELTRIDYHFYKLRGRNDIVVRNLEDAKKYSVGVVRDDVRHQYLQANKFTKLVVSAQNADSFRRLLNEQIQLLPISARDAAVLCKETRIDCSILEKAFTPADLATSLYMAYSAKTADEIVSRSRVAFERLKAEGFVAQTMSEKR